MSQMEEILRELRRLDLRGMYQRDFLLTWEKSDLELAGIFAVADALRDLRQRNISTKMYDSGLAVRLVRDGTSRPDMAFAGGCNLLGLEVQEAVDGTGETAGMLSFMADVLGIQDGLERGRGHGYMRSAAQEVSWAQSQGVMEQRPTLVNLQSDLDQPVQAMADALCLIHQFGGVERLRGKKLAVTWASGSGTARSASRPQSLIGLMSRFGMEVVLAHPEGYELMPEVEAVAAEHARRTGGRLDKVEGMDQALRDADVVCAQYWAPWGASEGETQARNALHPDWCCTEERMAATRDGRGLYLHTLPVEVRGGLDTQGEVDSGVFDRFRASLYQEASYQPYVTAAMILLARSQDPVEMLQALEARGRAREKRTR